MAEKPLDGRSDQEREQTGVLKAYFRTIKHYFGGGERVCEGVHDRRNPNMIIYPLKGLLFTGVLMFVFRLGSRRGVQAKLRGNGSGIAKFWALFKVENIPHGDTLNYGYQRVEVEEVQALICESVEQLIRQKVLYRYRLLGVYFLVVIDGTRVVTFRKPHCARCLKKVMSNGETLYYHPVLEAKLVTLTGFSFSLMTEFIENADLSADKQDCELKAFYRLAKRLKARFRHLAICLLLDGLFAGGPTFKIAEEYGWKYLIVLREDDLPNVHRSYATVLPHLSENYKKVCLVEKGQIVQEYHWAKNLAYTDTQNCPHSLNLIECLERQPNPQGQIQPLHYKWLTNFTLTSHNVDCLANQGGRLRWKIENKGFNVQKNSDLNLEHIYSADPSASKVFYLLMQLACILFQLMEKMQLAPGGLPQGLGRRQGSGFPAP